MSKKPKSKASANLKKIMTQYYMDNHQQAADGKFVVWIAIIVPTEILHGFDVVVAVPENHAAMCAAKGVGVEQAQKAEERGYSIDLCSYARVDLGTLFDEGRGSPSMGMPKPDLLISDNNNCSLLVKWFDVIHRELNVPHFVLDVPFCYGPQRKEDLEYILSQYGALIRKLEKCTGQKFDVDMMQQSALYSHQSLKQWKRFLGFATHRPSGITAFDTFLHMAPFITSMRGTPEILEHFTLLADEVSQRVARGDYPVPNEKYRLLWDNIAPWHQLRRMSTRLAERDANIVQATYTSCIGTIEGGVDLYEYDGSDPLRHLARTQNFSVCPYGLELRFKAMSEIVRRFAIDGVVFASNRSCKVYSLMQMDLQRRIASECNVRTVMIDVDHADERKYSDEKAFLQIEALLESIDTNL